MVSNLWTWLLLLANAGFVVATSLAVWKMWPLGLVLSLAHVAFLVSSIRKVESSLKEADDLDCSLNTDHDDSSNSDMDCVVLTEVNAHTQEETGDSPNETIASRNAAKAFSKRQQVLVPFLLSLLYGLALLGLGVPGAIVVFKTFPCYKAPQSSQTKTEFAMWQTNSSSLPEAVQKWDASGENLKFHESRGSARFAQLGGTLYFNGANPDSKSTLFSRTGQAKPKQVGNYSQPYWITKVANDTICFVSSDSEVEEDEFWYDMLASTHHIYCGNGSDGFRSLALGQGMTPSRLIGIGGKLWYWQTMPEMHGVGEEEVYGHAVISLNTKTMRSSSVSTIVFDTSAMTHSLAFSAPDDLCSSAFSKVVGIGGLFLVAFPVLFASGFVWTKKTIPSAPIPMITGFILVICFIWSMMDSYNGFSKGIFVAAPLCLLAWLIFFTFEIVLNPTWSRLPLLWGLRFCGFALFFLMMLNPIDDFVEMRLFSRRSDSELKDMFLSGCTAVLTCLGALATESIFLHILSVLNLMVLASFFALTYSFLTTGPTTLLIICVNCIVGGMGHKMHLRRSIYRETIVQAMRKFIHIFCVVHTTEEEDAVLVEELLTNEMAEQA